ncbi:MAG: hypothetical protein QUV07_13285 [Cyanobium sp. CZS 25K]|nr:hypothetical protein [Cyanobium sp. CZS25K]
MSHRILKKASAAALMAVGAGAVLSFSTPSQAATSCLAFGSDLFAPGYTCEAGDKLYSLFTIISDPGNLLLDDSSFTIADNDPSHSLTGSGAFGPGIYSFSYKMEIIPAAIGFREFALISASGSSSALPGPNNFSVTLSAALPNAAGPVTAVFPGGPNPSPTATFAPGVTEAIFTSTITVTGGVAQTFTNDLTQRIIGDPVPGPLPILGAGAAFGFSRKLRRRIKQTV